MTGPKGYVTIVVHRDGELDSQTLRLPAWGYQILKWSTVTFIALAILGAVLYAPIVRTATRVPGLNREIVRLSSENQQVRQLSATLDALEGRYEQLQTMLGANVVPEVGEAGDQMMVAPVVHARLPGTRSTYPMGPSQPTLWPLDSLFTPGMVTRRQGELGSGAEHRGVDIAVPTGTPIRASGGGVIREAGYDPEYGWFVLIDHPDGYQTMYGHASRILVMTEDSVDAGMVIALAGNTGRSTAPHLHFEMRRGDELIDPLTSLEQEQ